MVSIGLVFGGCFLMRSSPSRPDAQTVSGPALYVEGCESCHAAGAGTAYAQSMHHTLGIRCGQCHRGPGHPDFQQPVRDGTCGGCHPAQYEQTLASTHFATRLLRTLDADRAARAELREQGFIAETASGRRFVADETSGAPGGRLCAACHYDEHRLGLGAARRETFCVQCHTHREGHYGGDGAAPAATNRCVQCHVRAGETVTGQTVDTHRFGLPGAEGGTR